MTQELNEYLYKRYGFADRRYSRVEFGRAIAIDWGHEFNESIHCRFFVRVFDDDEIELSYTGNRPTNSRVENLQAPFLQRRQLTKDTPAELRALAAAYLGVDVPRHSKSWAFARTEASVDLTRFANHLEAFLKLREQQATSSDPDTTTG